jgi:hypothetical protein
MQQKFTSAHMSALWVEDVFKPKWVVIAKAYSTIRGDLGVANVQLNTFLNIVRPAIGIIGVDEYLEKMNWEVLTASDGTIRLQQTSPPNLSSFEEHLVFTNVTEWDLIAIAIANDYIPQGTVLQNAHLIQHGVFPAAATLQQPQPTQQPRPAQQPQPAQPAQQPQPGPQNFANRVEFFRSIAIDPIATASIVLGFDVKDMLRITGSQPIEWTRSLADLYNPATGFYDIKHTFGEQWNVGNINQPLSFDNIFKDSIRDGYIIPAGKVDV